jgi:hypothetical protein
MGDAIGESEKDFRTGTMVDPKQQSLVEILLLLFYYA